MFLVITNYYLLFSKTTSLISSRLLPFVSTPQTATRIAAIQAVANDTPKMPIAPRLVDKKNATQIGLSIAPTRPNAFANPAARTLTSVGKGSER